MEDEFDSGFEVTESTSDFSDDSSFDVDSVMDETDVFSDVEELPDFDDVEEDSFDVDAIMDEVEIPDEVEEIPVEEEIPDEIEEVEDIPVEEEIPDDLEMVADVPVEEEVVEEIPDEPELIEEVPMEEVVEDIPDEPEVVEEEIPAEEVVEDIPDEPEVVEEVVEDIPDEPEAVEEDIPTEEEVVEDIPDEPEVVEEEIPVEEVVEDIPDEPEVVEEEIPAEEVVEDIPDEPEAVEEDIPTEEIVEDIPAEPEVVEEEIPIEEVVEDIPDEPEVVEEDIPTEEVVEDIPAEEVVEDIPDEEVVEDIPAEPEAVEEDIPTEEVVEDIPDEPEVVEEDIPTEEVVEDIPAEPEVVEEEIPAEEVVEDIPDEPEVVEEDIPTEEVVEDIPDEPEMVEEIPAELNPAEPEITDDVSAEEETAEEIADETAEDVPEAEDAVEAPEPAEQPAAPVPMPADDDLPGADEPVAEELPPELPDTEAVPDQTDMPEEPQTAAGEPMSGEEEAAPVGGPGPAQTALGEYLAEHDYGREDYAEYSQDPEWQRLNNDFLVETGREPIDYSQPADTGDYGPGPAQTALGEYLAEHNYGREDYAEYSQDPEWQRLNNDFLVETGREPIDYPDAVPEIPGEAPEIPAEMPELPDEAPEIPAEIPEIPMETPADVELETSADAVPERVYDDFEETVRLDQEDFYDSGTFYTQGINEYGYTGTCGETSMATTMNRVLGTNEFTENKVLDVAVQEGLCDTESFDDSGGTTTDQFMELYDKMNDICGNQLEVERHDFENVLSMEEVAQRLDEGCTVNVAVDSETLWEETDPMGGLIPESRATDHWITVTGVQRSESGEITGFDIIDSGGGESYVDADKYQAMCYGTDSLELTDPTCIVVSKKDVPEVPEIPVQEVPETVEVPAVPDAAEPVADTPVLGPLEPNQHYESNGYGYETDSAGRIVSASGELYLADTHDRNPEAQLAAGGDDRALTDDGGHLIATRFGGSPELDNLVAENSYVNRSVFKRFENAWARDLEAGNRVLVNIEPYYGVDSQRPTHIAGNYTVIRPDGTSYREDFSITNEDMRAPDLQIDEDYDFGYDDQSTYQNLTPEQRLEYEEAMNEKAPRIDEGRIFTRDDRYDAFEKCPEDSDEAFELQRVIHQGGGRRRGGAV